MGGGGDLAPLGTFAQYVVVERDQVIPSPAHLDDEHVSAWPVGGVTAWRSVHYAVANIPSYTHRGPRHTKNIIHS